MSDTDPVEAITPDEPARWGEAAYNPETDSPPDDHHHQDDGQHGLPYASANIGKFTSGTLGFHHGHGQGGLGQRKHDRKKPKEGYFDRAAEQAGSACAAQLPGR